MREIEFRAWYKPSKKMFKVGQITLEKGTWSYEPDNKEHIGVCIPYQPSFILMQYTGLKDKNGKKIFEGDIVLYAENYKYIVCFGEYNKNPENCAEAVEIGFYLKSIKSKFMQHEEITPLYSIDGIAARFPKHCAEDDRFKESVDSLKLEVIGNIWDNPELLKEEL